MAAEVVKDADILIYMTQDALLAEPQSLKNLIESFRDPSVGMAYGRQLPHEKCRLIVAKNHWILLPS